MNNEFTKYELALKKIYLSKAFPIYKNLIKDHKNIIILGNGGSSSIASHICEDLTKIYNKRAFTFSDSSLLTCYINDYGMKRAYVEFLKSFCSSNTLVILISSSGKSENIINSIKYLEKNKINYGLLTGFSFANKANQISTNANFKFHVKSQNYGVIECIHQIFLHAAI